LVVNRNLEFATASGNLTCGYWVGAEIAILTPVFDSATTPEKVESSDPTFLFAIIASSD
jgi:hypothetical protein